MYSHSKIVWVGQWGLLPNIFARLTVKLYMRADLACYHVELISWLLLLDDYLGVQPIACMQKGSAKWMKITLRLHGTI